MWRFYRRRKSRKQRKESQASSPEPVRSAVTMENPSEQEPDTYQSFAVHMARYIGKTVTIFVNSGGFSGTGFTGVLLRVTDQYVQLLTGLGPAPSYPVGNSCTFSAFSGCSCKPYPYIIPYKIWNYSILSPGSVTYIPVYRITSFVHNTMK